MTRVLFPPDSVIHNLIINIFNFNFRVFDSFQNVCGAWCYLWVSQQLCPLTDVIKGQMVFKTSHVLYAPSQLHEFNCLFLRSRWLLDANIGPSLLCQRFSWLMNSIYQTLFPLLLKSQILSKSFDLILMIFYVFEYEVMILVWMNLILNYFIWLRSITTADFLWVALMLWHDSVFLLLYHWFSFIFNWSS